MPVIGQPDREVMSVQQAADVLCVSAATIDRWIDDGTLPAERTPDGSPRIRAEDVEKVRRAKFA